MSRKLIGAVAAAASMVVVSGAMAQVSMSPLTTFGTNGWLAPGAGGITWLTTNNEQRSMAFNPVTGNLLLTNGLGVRVIDSSTGVSPTFLSVAGIAGGTRALNTIGVTTDGVIYGTNLTSAAAASGTNAFKVYRWSDQGAAPVLAYEGNAGLAGARVGDSFAVFGSDASGRMAAGFSNSPTVAGNNSFSYLTTGAAPTATAISIASNPPAAGAFRLGITFVDADTLYGTQGSNILNLVSVSGSTGTLDDTSPWTDPNERGIGYAVVGGLPLLATVQSNSNAVRLYDVSSLENPVLLSTLNLTTSFVANGNGTAAIAWGNISGNTANLYALNTNNGIQAFTVVVPEPAALGLLAPAALLLARRRQA